MGVESGDQFLINSEILFACSGVNLSIRSSFVISGKCCMTWGRNFRRRVGGLVVGTKFLSFPSIFFTPWSCLCYTFFDSFMIRRIFFSYSLS